MYIFDNVSKRYHGSEFITPLFYTSCFVDCSFLLPQIKYDINAIIDTYIYGEFKRSSDVNEKPSYVGIYQKGTVSQNSNSHINESQRSNYI